MIQDGWSPEACAKGFRRGDGPYLLPGGYHPTILFTDIPFIRAEKVVDIPVGSLHRFSFLPALTSAKDGCQL